MGVGVGVIGGSGDDFGNKGLGEFEVGVNEHVHELASGSGVEFGDVHKG